MDKFHSVVVILKCKEEKEQNEWGFAVKTDMPLRFKQLFACLERLERYASRSLSSCEPRNSLYPNLKHIYFGPLIQR